MSATHPQTRADWNVKFLEAVKRDPEGAYRVISIFFSDQSNRQKRRQAEQHDAFQVIKRSSQFAIHHDTREGVRELALFVRRLVNALVEIFGGHKITDYGNDDQRRQLLAQLRCDINAGRSPTNRSEGLRDRPELTVVAIVDEDPRESNSDSRYPAHRMNRRTSQPAA